MTKAGRLDALLALRDASYGRSATGEFANGLAATFAINCVDEERLTDREMTDLGNEVNVVAPTQEPPLRHEMVARTGSANPRSVSRTPRKSRDFLVIVELPEEGSRCVP